MKTLSPQTICAGAEPLPGYVLEEVIGRGGFGEVWRCSAPGDMKKAMKFVLSNQGQSRASRELRSLMRIRGVRHPFMLTLERFEIVDEQLVIVTELADESLEDVYKRFRSNGSCGIPRDTLLSHMHDAADALDYLHTSYQLQHLDVKPGNMLMIGGHVKVADFGLLKDLRDVENSIVGGLTPIYAPPELFDGRPSMHSDQYSLAVMYQELLTGTRPFSGRTIAQLATQHIHSPPNLSPLPACDRVVAARALEKDPDRRFGSCREFVENLLGRQKSNHSVSANSLSCEEDTVDAIVEDLPQLGVNQTNQKDSSVRDVLVVALGGLGAECVGELRRRVSDLRISTNVQLHSVMIDTDISTIHAMQIAEVSDRIPKCNTIHTPLKSAHQYRECATDRLKTISRRWIYNVPRNASTEGMRPLGRLALVDHGELVSKKISESVQRLAEQSEGRTPKVYIVGSLMGGTASGMYIDVAHLLRHHLDEAKLADTAILSLLMTAPLTPDARNPLPLHTSQSAIKEIGHFLKASNGYPGDEGAGWPSVPAARTPLRNVYLIAPPQGRQHEASSVDTICEYLWSDADGCDQLLADARKIQKDATATIEKPSFRSVGVVRLGDTHQLEERTLGPSMARKMMLDWLGAPGQAKESACQSTKRLMRRIGLSTETVLQQVQDRLSESGMSIVSLKMLATANEDGTAPSLVSLAKDFSESGKMDWLAERWIGSLYRELSLGFTDKRIDLATAIELIQMIREKACSIDEQICKSIPMSEIEQDPSRVGSEREFSLFSTCVIIQRQLTNFAAATEQLMERLERIATIIAIAVSQTEEESSQNDPWERMPEEVRSLKGSLLNELHRSTISTLVVRPLNDPAANVDAAFMTSELSKNAKEILVPIVAQHCNQILADSEARALATKPDSSQTSETGTSIHSVCPSTNSLLGETLSTTEIPKSTEDTPITIKEAIQYVKPSLLSIGGSQRMILVTNNEVDRVRIEAELRAVYNGPVTIAVVPGSNSMLIHEAQQIDLGSLAARMSVLGGSNDHLTAKLASRSDIKW